MVRLPPIAPALLYSCVCLPSGRAVTDWMMGGRLRSPVARLSGAVGSLSDRAVEQWSTWVVYVGRVISWAMCTALFELISVIIGAAGDGRRNTEGGGVPRWTSVFGLFHTKYQAADSFSLSAYEILLQQGKYIHYSTVARINLRALLHTGTPHLAWSCLNS